MSKRYSGKSWKARSFKKKAKLIEVDDNPLTETKMVRIEYGPFIVANKANISS